MATDMYATAVKDFKKTRDTLLEPVVVPFRKGQIGISGIKTRNWCGHAGAGLCPCLKLQRNRYLIWRHPARIHAILSKCEARAVLCLTFPNNGSQPRLKTGLRVHSAS